MSDRGGAFPGQALLKAGCSNVLLNLPFYWREAKSQNVLRSVRRRVDLARQPRTQDARPSPPVSVARDGVASRPPERAVSSHARAAPTATPRAALRARGSPAGSPATAQREQFSKTRTPHDAAITPRESFPRRDDGIGSAIAPGCGRRDEKGQVSLG